MDAALIETLNAGCMLNNYEPVTFEELVENNRTYKTKMLELYKNKQEG